MTNESHARILQAYICRLNEQDILRLAERARAQAYAGAQLGTGSQIAEHNKMEAECRRAIASISVYDTEVIESIVNDERS